MSSGPQSCWDDEVAAERERRIAKIEAIPLHDLAVIIDKIKSEFSYLTSEIPYMSRSGWRYLDSIQQELKKLF